MIGIYRITNPEGKSYIGQSKNIHKRIKAHKYGDYKKNRKFNQSVLIYGWQNHKIEILCECNENDLNMLEQHFILLHDSVINGFNLSTGGKNPKYSDDTKCLMSLQRKGIKPTIEVLKNRKIGRDNNMDKFLNSMRTPERKNRISEIKRKTVQIIDGTKINIFNSCIEASIYFAISSQAIARYARGERNHKHLKIQYI